MDTEMSGVYIYIYARPVPVLTQILILILPVRIHAKTKNIYLENYIIEETIYSFVSETFSLSLSIYISIERKSQRVNSLLTVCIP